MHPTVAHAVCEIFCRGGHDAVCAGDLGFHIKMQTRTPETTALLTCLVIEDTVRRFWQYSGCMSQSPLISNAMRNGAGGCLPYDLQICLRTCSCSCSCSFTGSCAVRIGLAKGSSMTDSTRRVVWSPPSSCDGTSRRHDG